MRNVILYGGLWRVPKEKFIWLLEAIANSEGFFMADYGELIGNIDTDVSALKPEQAQELLDKYSND